MIKESKSEAYIDHNTLCTVRGLRDALNRYMENYPSVADKQLVVIIEEIEAGCQIKNYATMTQPSDFPGIEVPTLVVSFPTDIDEHFTRAKEITDAQRN